MAKKAAAKKSAKKAPSAFMEAITLAKKMKADGDKSKWTDLVKKAHKQLKAKK